MIGHRSWCIHLVDVWLDEEERVTMTYTPQTHVLYPSPSFFLISPCACVCVYLSLSLPRPPSDAIVFYFLP
jgi:hypothetical protein